MVAISIPAVAALQHQCTGRQFVQCFGKSLVLNAVGVAYSWAIFVPNSLNVGGPQRRGFFCSWSLHVCHIILESRLSSLGPQIIYKERDPIHLLNPSSQNLQGMWKEGCARDRGSTNTEELKNILGSMIHYVSLQPCRPCQSSIIFGASISPHRGKLRLGNSPC